MLNILCIEDTQEDNSVIKRYLKEFHPKHVFSHVRSYTKAVKIIEDKSFDIVFLDVNIDNGLSPEDATRIILQKCSGTPIFLMTDSKGEDIKDFVKYGAFYFLHKSNIETKPTREYLNISIEQAKWRLKNKSNKNNRIIKAIDNFKSKINDQSRITCI